MVESQGAGFAARLARKGSLAVPVGNVSVSLDQRGIALAGEGGSVANIPFGEITRIRFGAHPSALIFIWRDGERIDLYPTGFNGYAAFVRAAYDRIRRARPDDAIVETGYGYALTLMMLGGLAMIYLSTLVVIPLIAPGALGPISDY